MDNVSIGVTPIIENVTLNAGVNNQVIDITLIETAEVVQLDVAPNLIEVNIIRSEGEVQILQFASYSNFPATGKANYFYLAKDTNKLYRWTGSTYAEISALGYTAENTANKGIANGYAGLDSTGKVPSTQLPSYVDDVIEVANYAALPATGETGKIYITLDTNNIYRWSGSVYVEISTDKAVWGGITGTLANQTDLQSALNAKQNNLSGTGFVKSTAGTISYDTNTYLTTANAGNTYVPYTGAIADVNLGSNDITAASFVKSGGTSSQFLKADGSVDSTTYATDSNVVHKTGDESIAGVKTFTGYPLFNNAIYLKLDGTISGFPGHNVIDADTNGIIFGNPDLTKIAHIEFNNITGSKYFTLPDASGTLALTTDIPSLSGYVPTTRTISTTSPLAGGGSLASNLTLSIAKSTSTTDGYLSSTDWSTFNNKQSALTFSSPLVNTSETISISKADTSTDGYLSSTDWDTFNDKQAALSGTGFVKSTAGVISYDTSSYYLASNPNGYTNNTGTVTSVALTVPSAFSVSGSPITSSGTLAITATGDTTQYIAGDGSLVTFPSMSTSSTLIREVRNTTGATLTKGTIVYISGATGNKPTVSKAIATGDSTSAQTFGLVQSDIANNANGNIVCIGDLTGLDTSALTEGTQLYLSSTTAGAYTSTKQYAPAHLVYIGIVTRSHATLGQIEVKIQNGYELDELHNVAAQTPSNNDGLFYESSTSLWKNKTIGTVLGYTPANDSSVVHKTGDETIGGEKTFSSNVLMDGDFYLQQNSFFTGKTGYNALTTDTSGYFFRLDTGATAYLSLQNITTQRSYTLPDATGTIALTSDIPSLSGYVPTSRTITINGTSYDLSADRSWTVTGTDSTKLPLTGGTLTGDLTINNGSADGGQLVLASSGFSNWNLDNYSGSLRAYYGSTVAMSINSSLATTFSGGITAASFSTPATGTAGSTTWNFYHDQYAAGDFGIWAGSTNRVLINAAGNVGIGTSTPGGLLTLKNPSSDGSTPIIQIRDTSNVYEIGYLNFNQSTDMMTLMNKQAYSGSGIAFGTNNTERMRINSGGDVFIGATGALAFTSSGKLNVQQSANLPTTMIANSNTSFTSTMLGLGAARYTSVSSFTFLSCLTGNSSGDQFVDLQFYVRGDGVLFAKNSTVQVITSDVNLKTNIVDYDKGLKEVLKMKPRYFNYKDNLEETMSGFIAQEMEEAVAGSMVDSKVKGYKSYQMDWNPILVRAIQELKAELDALKNK